MIRRLIYYGHSGLRRRCLEITEITGNLLQIAQDLIETVLNLNGAGLAAPQIGEYVRMFVICYDNGMSEGGGAILSQPKIYINPTLSEPSAEVLTYGEGCLSIPGIYEEIPRPAKITIEAMDLDGNVFVEQTTMWRARSIMHENDHLNGTLFIDRIPLSKVRKRIAPDLKKIKKTYNTSQKLS